MSKKNEAVAINNEEVTVAVAEPKVYKIEDLMIEHKTKSAVIRYLHSEGLSRSAIVKIFNDGGVKMIYQHVRNVLITPLKKNEETKNEEVKND